MKKETTVARSIRLADGRAAYDAACKQILANKYILAWIMKSCLDEYRDCEIKEIAERYIEGTPEIGAAPVMPDEWAADGKIHGDAGEDSRIAEGVVTYDIRFRAIAPGREGYLNLIINVEAQKDYYPGYPLLKRGIYYCSRLLSSQYDVDFSNAAYEKLKKVYSVWICLNPPDHRKNTIMRYSMTEEIFVGEACEPKENYDLMTVVMVHLGKAEEGEEGSILRLLDVLFTGERNYMEKKNILENEFAIPMTRRFEKEVANMCNFSEYVEERGIERGRLEMLTANLRNLMDNLNLTLEQAMDALNVAAEDRETIAALV